MTHISRYAADLEAFGPGTQDLAAAAQGQLVVDEADRAKALVVLRALSDAGLREPYGFNREDARDMWASALRPFSVDTCMAGVGDWIAQAGTDWPSLGDMLAMARGVELEERAAHRAMNTRECTECHDVHWVKVITGVEQRPKHLGAAELIELEKAGAPWPTFDVTVHHYAPCPACPEMAQRRALYDSGHFTTEHQDRGGCPECWPYTDRQRARARDHASSGRGRR